MTFYFLISLEYIDTENNRLLSLDFCAVTCGHFYAIECEKNADTLVA